MEPPCKICGLCDKIFIDQKSLSNHISNVHESSNDLSAIHDGSNISKCHICGKHFLQKSGYELKKHILRVHKNMKIYRCLNCDKTYPYKDSLKKHVRVTHDRNKYTCDICNESYTEKRNF